MSSLPSPGDDDVTVSVEGAVFGAPERAARARGPGGPTPGGAAVGTVSVAGANAGELAGARVLVGPVQPCGECDVCRRGGAAVCPTARVLGETVDGALAAHVIAGARWVQVLAGELDVPGEAAALLAREAAWAYAMYARAGVSPGEPVVVVGDDVVTRFCVEILEAKGTRPIAVTGEHEAWRAFASARDVHHLAAAPEDAVALAARVDVTAAAAGFHSRPWKVFCPTTSPAWRRVAAALRRPRTTLTLLSLGAAVDGDEALDVAGVLAGDGAVLGVAGAHPDLVPEVAAMAVRGEIDVAGAALVCAADDVAEASARTAGTPTGIVVKLAS